jgi:hypothetical protein
VICIALTWVPSVDAASKAPKQKGFASPEEAVGAFVEALRADDKKELRAILGPQNSALLRSGDSVVDKTERETFLKLYDEGYRVAYDNPAKAILHVGKGDWPLPFPMVKRSEKWFFDARASQDEILSRRIGRNELAVIEVMREYTDAQREYADKDRDGDGVLEYAQKLVSAKDQQDGLFWEKKEGTEASPFGPLFARAAAEGYRAETKKGKPAPFHGYMYKVLKGQGKHATGGAYTYVVKGNMILGFGLVAYPARYGSSGIMTFIVNQEGKVYEKNLGKDTVRTASKITLFDPDPTWKLIRDLDGKPAK